MRERGLTWLLIFSLALGACNFPGQSAPQGATQPPLESVYTQAAQTLVAELTATAAAQAALFTPTQAQPLDTPTLSPPSETLPPPTADIPTLTPTAAVPMISSTTATNCRLGPGRVYEPPVSALLVNQTSQVYGRNDTGTWWYIEDPARPGRFCWVWDQTTRVEGDTSQLPIITPPPPPPTATPTATPGVVFTVSYDNVHNCSGDPTAIFKVVNSGSAALESLRLRIDDLTDNDTLFGPSTSDAPFMGAPGECPPGGDALQAGDTLYVGGAIGAGNNGHSARATINLCTEDDLDGSCVEKTVNFTIP